jgi:hypothetical protein
MTRAAQKILKTFDELAEDDKQEIAVEILRRTPGDYTELDDSDLVFAADQIFLELDRREESE